MKVVGGGHVARPSDHNWSAGGRIASHMDLACFCGTQLQMAEWLNAYCTLHVAHCTLHVACCIQQMMMIHIEPTQWQLAEISIGRPIMLPAALGQETKTRVSSLVTGAKYFWITRKEPCNILIITYTKVNVYQMYKINI